ncbi:MAG: response regulator transcription factor [Sulfurimonas sp.]|uniref:response regulator transcription factor n=1 Tax=Sulfurimonas sp. TaxID=2022749 RepID=UPI00262D85BE|nr:response regulator transcription factor [Sulfurimonas sp.]MDD5373216.1 response regulator transcription factor [Sulfurimonas sp.]
MKEKGSKLRLLILEDDLLICDIMSEFLSGCGYEVICVNDGNEAVDKAYEEHFDAFIFDVKVPLMNGFDVLKTLREAKQGAPAIFVTSLASIADLSKGYDAGCDDYIKKPFELKELQLRLEKLIQKSFSTNNSNKITLTQTWSFEPNNGKLFSANEELFLTKKETKLLNILISHKGKMVSNEQIIASVWNYDDEATEENLRTHIKKLRKILGKEIIQNVRKQGYLIVTS